MGDDQYKRVGISDPTALAGSLEPEGGAVIGADGAIYPEIQLGEKGAVLRQSFNDGSPLFNIQGNPLTIKIVKGKLKVSTPIRDQTGRMVAELIDSEWAINPNNFCDRNYTDSAVEVKDQWGNIVLQARLSAANRVQLQLINHSEEGVPVGFVNDVVEVKGKDGITTLRGRIKPIFRYPSALHLGEYVT